MQEIQLLMYSSSSNPMSYYSLAKIKISDIAKLLEHEQEHIEHEQCKIFSIFWLSIDYWRCSNLGCLRLGLGCISETH